MSAGVSELADLLAALGGSLALSFIVALALSICALTLLFLASAVVVLERFAREARFGLRAAVVVAVWSLALGPLVLSGASPELQAAPLGDRLVQTLGAVVALAVVIAGVALAVRLLLARVSARTLALCSALALGAGYALLAAGVGRAAFVWIPAGTVLAFGVWLRWRSTRGRPAAAEAEPLAFVLGAALLVGGLIPAFGLGRDGEVASVGAAVLMLVVGAIVLGLVPLAAIGFLGMRGTAEWFVATRYLFAKRRQTFISVITGICVAGVAAGVWLIVIVLSVMNGFERTWRDEIIGNRAHFTIHSLSGPIEDYERMLDVVDGVEGITGAAPYVDAEGMVRGEHGEIVAVRVRGIDPVRIRNVTDLESDLRPGSEEALERLTSGGEEVPGIVVGSQLASHLGLRIGEELVLISPFGGPPTPLGPGPRLKKFRVEGVFKSSFFQYDEVFTYTTLEAARDFRGYPDAVQGIEVRTTDFYRSQRVAAEVERALEFAYYTRDWKEFFPSFFQALKTERVMMFVLLTMIMVVAAFAIVVTLIMMIMEKSSDIAILKTMGATDATVERIFAIEGTLIGLLGTALGVVAGIAVTTQLAWVQRQIEIVTGIDTLPATVYQFSTLPWEINPIQVAIVISIAMILSLGATLLPSRHGARLDPAEALRYE